MVLCQEKASMKENNKKKSGKAGVHMETAVAEEIPCNPCELTEKGTALQVLVTSWGCMRWRALQSQKCCLSEPSLKTITWFMMWRESLRSSAAFCLSLSVLVLCSTFSSLLTSCGVFVGLGCCFSQEWQSREQIITVHLCFSAELPQKCFCIPRQAAIKTLGILLLVQDICFSFSLPHCSVLHCSLPLEKGIKGLGDFLNHIIETCRIFSTDFYWFCVFYWCNKPESVCWPVVCVTLIKCTWGVLSKCF